MIINDGFYLNGFTRADKGEAGAVFIHYEEATEAKLAARNAPVTLNQTGAQTYSLSIPIEINVPKAKPARATACAIVTRTSKNCYQATAYDARRIKNFKADTLDGLRNMVAEFFREGGIA